MTRLLLWAMPEIMFVNPLVLEGAYLSPLLWSFEDKEINNKVIWVKVRRWLSMPRFASLQEASVVMSSISSFKSVLLQLSKAKFPREDTHQKQKGGVLRPMPLLIKWDKIQVGCQTTWRRQEQGEIMTIPVWGGDAPLLKAKQNRVNGKKGTGKLALTF